MSQPILFRANPAATSAPRTDLRDSHRQAMTIGSLHSARIDVGDGDQRLHHTAPSLGGHLNDQKARIGTGRGLRVAGEGVGPSGREEHPVAGWGDTSQVGCRIARETRHHIDGAGVIAASRFEDLDDIRVAVGVPQELPAMGQHDPVGIPIGRCIVTEDGLWSRGIRRIRRAKPARGNRPAPLARPLRGYSVPPAVVVIANAG